MPTEVSEGLFSAEALKEVVSKWNIDRGTWYVFAAVAVGMVAGINPRLMLLYFTQGVRYLQDKLEGNTKGVASHNLDTPASSE